MDRPLVQGNSNLVLLSNRKQILLFNFFIFFSRNSKPKNRPSFQQVLLHVEIAAGDVLKIPQEVYQNRQVRN